MKHLKIQIENLLLELCDNVYLEHADDDSLFPYLVYSLSSGTRYEDSIIYFLDVDVWDKAETTENIDDIEKKLRTLNKLNYIDDDIQFTMYFDRVINTKSEHKELKRYTIIFEIKCIERSKK